MHIFLEKKIKYKTIRNTNGKTKEEKKNLQYWLYCTLHNAELQVYLFTVLCSSFIYCCWFSLVLVLTIIFGTSLYTTQNFPLLSVFYILVNKFEWRWWEFFQFFFSRSAFHCCISCWESYSKKYWKTFSYVAFKLRKILNDKK